MGAMNRYAVNAILAILFVTNVVSSVAARPKVERRIEVNETVEVELTKTVTHFSFVVETLEPGYVELNQDKKSADVCQTTIRWSGGKARSPGAGSRIRVSGNEEQRGKIKLVCHEENLPRTVSLQITFHEEMDFLEPNNKSSQASQIEMNRWYQIAYATEWDAEYVSVDIKEAGYLAILSEGTAQSVGATIAYDDSGRELPNRTKSQLGLQPLFAVTPGRVLLKIGGPGTNPQLAPFQIKLAFVKKFNQLTSEDGPIVFGKTYLFGRYGSHQSTRFSMELDSHGVVALNPRDLPSGLSHLRWQVVREETVVSNQRVHDPMNLAAGSYEVLIYTNGLGSALKQSIFMPTFEPTSEPDEFNDTAEFATAKELNQPFETSISPFNDVDLYRITVPGDGHLAIMPSGYDPYRNPDVGIDVLSADGHSVVGKTGQHPKLNLNRVVAVTKGEYLVRMRGVGKRAPKGRFTLEINFVGEDASVAPHASQGFVMGLVGIGLDETQQIELQATAAATNTPLVMNSDLDQLTQTLSEITQQSIEAAKAKSVVVPTVQNPVDESTDTTGENDFNWWYSLTILLFAIIGIGLIVRKLIG